VYIFELLNPKVHCTPEKALDGKFMDIQKGECASTGLNDKNHAWWETTLDSVSRIFKLNLIFRKNCK
jgi:hypothetical protein